MSKVKERPILFSGPMVRAILEGRKTQTRRVVKPQPDDGEWLYDDVHCALLRHDAEGFIRCPYGGEGDRLWGRETWALTDGRFEPLRSVAYRADGEDVSLLDDRWRPSIHMPRWASRILLEVTEVRVQRLQDITDEDAVAEGVRPIEWTGGNAGSNRFTVDAGGLWLNSPTASGAFSMLWQVLHGEGSWEANPWVWAITFRRVEA